MPSPGPGPWSGTPARRCPGCGRLRSTRCGAAAARTTGWALGDAALVKDNHVAAAGGVATAVRAVRAAARPGLVIEVECDSVAQVREALEAGARFILLDNMPVPTLREAVAVARAYDGVRLEASGGLRLANAREVAQTGVDYLSVGALTHSSRALDLGLDYSGSGLRRACPFCPGMSRRVRVPDR